MKLCINLPINGEKSAGEGECHTDFVKRTINYIIRTRGQLLFHISQYGTQIRFQNGRQDGCQGMKLCLNLPINGEKSAGEG